MMSEETSVRVRLPLTAWVGMAVLFAGAAGSAAVAQFQLANHAQEIERLKVSRELDAQATAQVRELLVRIDERTAEMKRQLERHQ